MQATAKPVLVCAKEIAHCFMVWRYSPITTKRRHKATPMKMKQWWAARSEQNLQKRLKYHFEIEIPNVAFLGLKSAHVFVVSWREPFSLHSCRHYPRQTTQASLSRQTEAFPRRFADDFRRGSFRSVSTLLYSFWAHLPFAGILRWHHCKRNLQAYQNSSETNRLLAARCLRCSPLRQCVLASHCFFDQINPNTSCMVTLSLADSSSLRTVLLTCWVSWGCGDV